ncbi:response regulator transcription factor [Mucilaginibacter psychrotolerans]|uniref:Response regulator transcription factor n=1 Tax=Mucilaginibacter psychrotolerans TaxID=1524096 RepID=A0A4Y8S4S3_9SPHI|nr:response regulator transcription factor [Mucilaginibacter psychrotolerans]TFF33938.1 response regulator transcription factor [Mucilaginibacter psychrotolerans]
MINIAIVDDHTLFRNGVAALMKDFDELNIVFEAGNGEQLQQIMKQKPLPDVVLMDINMPVMDGYAATTWLRKNHPDVKVLALSMYEDDKSVIKMIQCGAGGYVLKQSGPVEVLTAIKTIFEKGVFINELVSGKLIRSVSNQQAGPWFSKNEVEFLKLCCSELTYKEMAEKMFVSPRTIDNYRESLFAKLGLKSRTGLVLYAIQNKIIEL